MFDRFSDVFNKLLGRGNSFKQTAKGRRPATRRLRFEGLERREMMTATPAAPVFAATAYSASQVNLSWNAVPGATGYLVDEYINGAWQQVANFNSSVHGSMTTGLSAGTTYYFDVAAYNSAGWNFAHYQGVTTGIAVDHPAAVNDTTGQVLPYSNVSGSLFGANGPSYLDVNQGQEGDCWLDSSLAEVAARDPADIKNMFSYAGTTVENGTTVNLYNVRFYNSVGTATYVTVDTELPSGGNYYDQAASGPMWVALAEKAYAQANGKGYVTTAHVGLDSYDALGNLNKSGGNPVWALQAITGKSANSFSVNPTNIASAWNAGQLIVIGSDSTPVNSNIVSSHAYAVVGYNASSNQPFTVYNPWGIATSASNHVYGQFTANAPFISQNFAHQFIGVGAEAGLESSGNGLQGLVNVTDTHAATLTAGTQDHGQANGANVPATTILPATVSTLAVDSVFAAWGEDAKPAKLNSHLPSSPAFGFEWNTLPSARETQLAFRS